MASNVRQNRTLEAYCCLRGLENEVTSDFCLAPFYCTFLLFKLKVYSKEKGPLYVHISNLYSR